MTRGDGVTVLGLVGIATGVGNLASMSTLAQLVFILSRAFRVFPGKQQRYTSVRPSYNQRTVVDNIFDARRRCELICSCCQSARYFPRRARTLRA